MKKASFLRAFLHKAYSLIVMPLGVLALTLIISNNLPSFHIDPNDILEPDYSPRSRVLGLKENLEFQRFVFVRTYFVFGNQCSVKPELRSVIQKDKFLH